MADLTIAGNDPLIIKVESTPPIERHKLFRRVWWPEQLDKIEKELYKLYAAVIEWMQDEIIPLLPDVGGSLGQSYTGTEIRGEGIEVEAFFGSDSIYAGFVEEGTGDAAGHEDYFPPPAMLELWVNEAMGVPIDDAMSVAWLVARHISVWGTEAQPIVGDWLDENEDLLFRKILAGYDEVFSKMTAA